MSVEALAHCPFSLVVDEAHRMFDVLESPTPQVRLRFRDLGVPLLGSFGHRVVTRFHRAPDRTERGREHDEIVFGWDAQSWFLPNFRGTLRFRARTISETRLLLGGVYTPPLGPAGKLFDRIAGHRLARATLAGILEELARNLETMWTAEKTAPVMSAT